MSLVKQALILEIRKHMECAIDFKSKVDNAKTEAKRNVYKKKLKKNNLQAADLFHALDRLLIEEAKKVADGAKDEVPILEGRAAPEEGSQQSVE